MSTKRANPALAGRLLTVIAGSLTLKLAVAGVVMVLLGVVLDSVGVLGAIVPVILFIWGIGIAVGGFVTYALIWYNKPT